MIDSSIDILEDNLRSMFDATVIEFKKYFMDYLIVEKGFSKEQISEFFNNRYETLSKDWDSRSDDVSFYSSTMGYLFDLYEWNTCDMYFNIIKCLLGDIVVNNLDNVLDYGGGLGFLSIFLKKLGVKNVTYVDIPGETMSCANYLFNRFGVSVKMLSNDFFMSYDSSFDYVVAIDVIEHIKDFMPVLIKLTKSTSLLAVICNWSKDDGKQPMHYDYGFDIRVLLLALSFEKVNTYTYARFNNKKIIFRLIDKNSDVGGIIGEDYL